MRIIRSVEDVKGLEGLLNEELRKMVETDFQHMVYWINAQKEEYDPDEDGISLIIEKGDSIEGLVYFGIENINETFPKTMDEIKIDNKTIVKSLICNNDYNLLIYVIKEEVDLGLIDWIEENK